MEKYYFKLSRPTPYGTREEKTVYCTRNELDNYTVNGWKCTSYRDEFGIWR